MGARCGLLGDVWEVGFEAAGGFGLGRKDVVEYGLQLALVGVWTVI